MVWLVVGAGKSGIAAARLLASKGEVVRISEAKAIDREKKDLLGTLGIELCDGGHNTDHFENVSHIVPSPGVPLKSGFLSSKASKGIPIVSEVDLGLKDYSGSLFAVTGTNGKSTTCALIGHLLQTLGKHTQIGGNFGTPPSEFRILGPLADHFVLEISSYQLETVKHITPICSVFTSFSQDHMQRHGDLESYFRLKWKIFDLLPPSGHGITTPEVFSYAKKLNLTGDLHPRMSLTLVGTEDEFRKFDAPPGKHITVNKNGKIRFKDDAITLKDLPALAGLHNTLNVAFAFAALNCAFEEVSLHTLASALDSFRGLKYRCELMGTFKGFPIINDSKSTNLESVQVALSTMPANDPFILLLGGQSKGEDFKPLANYLNPNVHIFTFGQAGKEIAQAIGKNLRVACYPTLSTCMNHLKTMMDTSSMPILFSPGCASFDEFANFEHRGEFFEASILKWGIAR